MGRKQSDQLQKVTVEAKLSGDRIRIGMRLAKDGPINQAELSRRTGIGSSTLGQWIQGKRHLPIHAARRIEGAIGVPAAFLMGLIDEQEMELLRLPQKTRAALLALLASMGDDPFEEPQTAHAKPRKVR